MNPIKKTFTLGTQQVTLEIPGGMKVRISAGIAELHQGETAASLFERADTALYRAKELGKNRAAVAPES